jgi:regulator of ribonuclease activity B
VDEASDKRFIARLVERGVDLTKPLNVGIHIHAPSQAVADAVVRELRAEGLKTEVFNLGEEWVVGGLGKWMIVNDQTIADLRLSYEDLAGSLGATYTGWQVTGAYPSPALD